MKLFTFITAILTTLILQAQDPAISWQKSYGGSNDDEVSSIQQTTDGGYILAGTSSSTDGDVTGNHGEADYWIVKLNSTGNISWQKSYGGSNSDWISAIQQTTDGGYIVAGSSMSTDGDVNGNHGDADYWIVKLNSTGNIMWQKSYGGSSADYAESIKQTTDGGYIIAGFSESTDGDVTENYGYADYWIVKLNSTGNIMWQKSYGGSSIDRANSIQQTSDGGFIVAGEGHSIDGDVTGHHGVQRYPDYWIVKLNSSGTILWQKSYGGSSYEIVNSIQQTSDGGYIVAGGSDSYDGDVTGNHGIDDCWIVKLNSTGNIMWQKSYGGSSRDEAFSIQQTSDGGYIVAGYSESTDGDVTGNYSEYDYWVVKLNSTGNIMWQKCLGGSGTDWAFSIQKTADSGYIVAGRSHSTDGDVTGHHGDADFWVVKLSK